MLTGPDGHRVVFLLDASSNYEAKLMRRWLARRVDDPETLRIKSSRRKRSWSTDDLARVMESTDPLYFIPVRVMWMAPSKGGRRSVGWSEAFKPGDPRDPRGLRARMIRTFRPSRVKLIAATGASREDLHRAYDESGEIDGMLAFITRRAWRTLDKAERRLRGNRYKIPRFVPEAILSRGEFARALDNYSRTTGTDRAKARQEDRKSVV